MKKYKERVEKIMEKSDKFKERIKNIRMKIFSMGFFAIILVSAMMLNINIPMKQTEEIIVEKKLPKFTSTSQLVQIVEEHSANDNFQQYYNTSVDFAINDIRTTQEKGESSDTISKTYSETNTQVQGVDESDIVKTNGDYIYYITNNKLVIINSKTQDIKLEKSIDFAKNEYVNEMYIDDKYLVVIGDTYLEEYNDDVVLKQQDKTCIYNPTNCTKLFIYDINSLDLIREVETEGRYLSSRKINDDIYIVTNKTIYNLGNSITEENILPIYKDTCISNEYNKIPATDIAYFDNFTNCSYMLVTSLSLDNIDEKANIQTYLGAGSDIYASKKSLYVANVEYKFSENILSDTTNKIMDIGITPKTTITTSIHKFSILGGDVKYIETGKVDGALLNQFSMDENNGNFRITTTNDNTWDDTSENNLYILNSQMNVIGKLTGLAKGERIYSTRFMGDKCYVVTYKTVDPLFVLDLSDSTNPKVLGELKIPGYSKYLHPFKENYLIGFGEDSVEKTYKNWEGEQETIAYATGMKMAIFDVTDYSNPKELYSIKIGGRGSYSELLNNHKSLLFNEEEGIFAFPAILNEETKYDNSGIPLYGKTIFNGALVYNISIENGINLRGKISHGTNEGIDRIIRINNGLYTLSNNIIKVSDINNVKEINKLSLK